MDYVAPQSTRGPHTSRLPNLITRERDFKLTRFNSRSHRCHVCKWGRARITHDEECQSRAPIMCVETLEGDENQAI